MPNKLAETEMQTIDDTLTKLLVGLNAYTGGVSDTWQHIGRRGKQKCWWTEWLTG